MADFNFTDKDDLKPKPDNQKVHFHLDNYEDLNNDQPDPTSAFYGSDNVGRQNGSDNTSAGTTLLDEAQNPNTYFEAQKYFKSQQNGQGSTDNPVSLYKTPTADAGQGSTSDHANEGGSKENPDAKTQPVDTTKDGSKQNPDVKIQPVESTAGTQREKPESQKTATKSGREFETNEKNNSRDYAVKPKDTMWSIAKDVLTHAHPDHKPTAKEIMAAVKEIAKNSNISDPTLIKPGQKIHVAEHYFKDKDTQRKAEDKPKTQDTPQSGAHPGERPDARPSDNAETQRTSDTKPNPQDTSPQSGTQSDAQSTERASALPNDNPGPQQSSDTKPNAQDTSPLTDTQASERPNTTSEADVTDASSQQITALKTQDITPVSMELVNVPKNTDDNVNNTHTSQRAETDLQSSTPTNSSKPETEKSTLPDTAMADTTLHSEPLELTKEQIVEKANQFLRISEDTIPTKEVPSQGATYKFYSDNRSLTVYDNGVVVASDDSLLRPAQRTYYPNGVVKEFQTINGDMVPTVHKETDGTIYKYFYDDAGKRTGDTSIYTDGTYKNFATDEKGWRSETGKGKFFLYDEFKKTI